MKKHGFTLIELLGVIVILSVIALIATPMILGVIEKTKKGSLKNSAYGILEAATLYYAEYQNAKTVRFDIEDNEIITEEENILSYKGNIKNGTVLINQKGEITICMNDGTYAAYKNYSDQDVTIVDQKTCTVPENNYIVYLDGESTITELTNQELTAKIEELEQKIIELEQNKTNTEETVELAQKHDSDVSTLTTNLNTNVATINSRLDSLTSNLNNQIGSTNISSIGGTITGTIYWLNTKLNYLSMYDNYLVNESFDFNDLINSYVINVNENYNIENAPYEGSLRGFLEMNFAGYIGCGFQRFTEYDTGKMYFRSIWYGQWTSWKVLN